MLCQVDHAHETSPDPVHVDQRITLHGVTWDQYEAVLAMRRESSALRVTYLEGELEIMAPSIDHETLKTRIGRLLEAWAEEMDIPLEGAGSWTVKLAPAERGAEADECYFVGGVLRTDHPDIAIDVAWTRGGIPKLEVWRGLGVPEVWIWEAGALHFHVLRGSRYEESGRSELLPDLDPAVIVGCMAAPTQTAAVRQLRAELRAAREAG